MRVAKNFYEILGIPRTASDLEIKSAYHRLARRYHPDKAESPEQAVSLEAEFSQISTAYNTLKDKSKRPAYDKSVLTARGQAAGTSQSNMPTTSGFSVASGDGKPVFGNAATEQNRATVAKRAFVRGTQMMTTGDYTKASELFEMAIKNSDQEPVYYARLALALLRGHRSFSRATEAAQRAIELDPYNSDYRLVLAELYESANIKSMAIKTYQEILKWDPANDKARMALECLAPSKKSMFLKFFGRKS